MTLTSPPKGGFRITRRHYDIILKQGLDLLPIEAGGFLGGDIESGTIKAIFPIYNQHLEVQTDTFGFMPDDLGRARSFFKKHNLEYFSMYHTHPKGIAYPSQTDINAGHWFHFILSLRDKKNPDFRAFFIQNKKTPVEVPFVVVEDKGFHKKDLASGIPEYDASTQARMQHQDTGEELTEKLDKLKNKKENPYERYQSHNPNSDFNTLA